MSDDLQAYFSREEGEKTAHIEVLEGKIVLPHDAVMRLCVEELTRCSISLFERALVVGAYGAGYQATWAPNCLEFAQTFAGQDTARALLQHAYLCALQEQGFRVATPIGGMTECDTDARERLRREPYRDE